ncbi:MAG: alpha/beta hydrolase [Myxococcaceae bacterium]
MPPVTKPARGTFHHLGPYEVPGLSARPVRVYQPAGLEGGEPWAALFVFDGQNVFGDEGSFSTGWHLDEAVDRLARRRFIAPLVVAIPHGGERRMDELGPWRAGSQGGLADPLLDWVVGTLVPEVRRRFPVAEGPAGAALAGSSMGGLAALYGHLRHPDVFGGAICLSPSLWFAYPEAFRYVGVREKPFISRIYLDCGAKEAGGRMLPATRDMAELLGSRGYGPDQLMFRADPRGTHNERHWRRRLPRALRFMYRRW